MPITNDDELAEALDILESPDVAQTLKDGVRRAAEHYRSMRLAGASPDTLGQMYAPTGIGAIEQGQEELRPFGHARNQAIPRELTPNRAMVQDVAEDPTAPEQVSPGARTVRPAQARMAPLDPRDELAAFATALPGGVIPGATELIEAGIGTVSPETSTEMREFRREHPQMTSGGTFIGAALPWGVEATIAKTIGTGIPRALPRAAAAAPNTVRAGSAALGAGTAAVTGGAMRDAADQLSRYGLEGVTPPSAEDAAGRFLAGAALGGGADVLGAAAGSLARSTRSNPKLGPEVERFERAGGELGIGGPKPSPAMRATQAEVERRARQGEVVSPTDVALERIEEPIARAALRRQTDVANAARAETEAYNAVAGDTPLETEGLLRSGIDELKARSFSSGGGPLPAQRPTTSTIRRTIVEPLMEPEVVPGSAASAYKRGGAIVMTPDELQRIGIDSRALTERATAAPGVGEIPVEPLGSVPGVLPRMERDAVAAHKRAAQTMNAQVSPTAREAVRKFTRGFDDTIRRIQRGELSLDDYRAMDPQRAAEAEQAIAGLDEFFQTAPPSKDITTAYRGLVLDETDAQRFLGSEFDFGGMTTSASYDPIVARSFVARNRSSPDQFGITLKLKHRSGRSVEGLSDPRNLDAEKELLFPGDASFRVTRRYVDPNDPRNIVVEAEEGLGGVPAIVMRSRQMNPREVDRVAGDIDNARKVEQASNNSYDPYYDTAAREIRNIRDTAPMVPGVADETTVVKGYDTEGNVDVRRGLSGLKGQQAARQDALEADLEGAGLPRTLPSGRSVVLPPGGPVPGGRTGATTGPVTGAEIEEALQKQSSGMKPESMDYLRAGGQPGNANDVVRIESYPDNPVTIANGRHRIALAREQKRPSVRGDYVRYDADGNVVEHQKSIEIPVSREPLGPNVDPVPALDPKQRDAFRTRITNYERTPGAEETQAEPLRRFADMAGVTRELNELPGLTAWQHLTGRSAASKAVHGVASGGGVSGYVSSGAGDFLRLRLDSASEALGGIPGTLSDTGARRALAQQLSPGLIRLLRSMRAGATTATGKQGGIGTQLFGLRGGPAGARAAATLTDEDIANLQALVAAQQPPAEEITE